jgi:hypothetical protein
MKRRAGMSSGFGMAGSPGESLLRVSKRLPRRTHRKFY